ncbi:hypothetical protein GGD56_000522 [Rhizobium mongolense]|uniref:DUF1868 domain-containing protein n=1 Tax=Rhizobium mongolense TaxID=57676 RepID=A0ABR6IFP9_9HYPH|nr:hypothetical protein [Rhizobium mongolense]
MKVFRGPLKTAWRVTSPSSNSHKAADISRSADMEMDTSSFSPELLHCSKAHNPSPPGGLGRRYDRSGNFLQEPGNTVVCHLVEGSETEKAVIAARAKYLAMPEASQFAFTPISSLHMTLFQGIIEYRRRLPFWPVGVDLDTPIEVTTELFLKRLKSFTGYRPFRVHVTKAEPRGMVVEGLTADDRNAMKGWRDALADIFGYRHPDHDTYEFHITFSYVIERLDETALPHWQQMLGEVVGELSERAAILELRPPAFCAFNDMTHFEELRVFNFS